MLTLPHTNEWHGKCPRRGHRNINYAFEGEVPASCPFCQRLRALYLAHFALESARRVLTSEIEHQKERAIPVRLAV